MSPPKVQFGKRAVQQLSETVATVQKLLVNPTPAPRARWQKGSSRFAVVLDASLTAASNAMTGASSCLATVCVWDGSDYTETDEQVTVWNHSESTDYPINTFGIADTIDGHYWFLGDCEAMATRA